MNEQSPQKIESQALYHQLRKPKKIEVEEETLTDFYGKFLCEPLERGFGITIGNSLRRILLSSLLGAAITSVKIDGVLHEFTSLPNVKEDIIDILLNLKGVVLKIDGSSNSQRLLIDVTTPKEVTAGDIISNEFVKVINPDHYITTVSQGGKLRMEMWAERGRGYVPAERLRKPDVPLGTLFLDAVFSPIKKVTYTVTQTRVDEVTNYDKLIMEVWTDGSVHPKDAISYAAKILKDQLTVFIGVEEVEEKVEKVAVPLKPVDENLFKKIEDLELSVRSQNCLASAGIVYIGDLIQRTEAEMLKTKNFGRKSLKEIKEVIDQMGLKLGTRIDNWDELLAQRLKEEQEKG
jgi:DNA-directed RNA polymerase subunit alpha